MVCANYVPGQVHLISIPYNPFSIIYIYNWQEILIGSPDRLAWQGWYPWNRVGLGSSSDVREEAKIEILNPSLITLIVLHNKWSKKKPTQSNQSLE